MNKTIKSWSQPLAGVVIVFVIWYLVCKTEILSAYVLPPPEKVFRSFLKMLQSGELVGVLHQPVHSGLCAGLCAWHVPGTVSGNLRLL